MVKNKNFAFNFKKYNLLIIILNNQNLNFKFMW